MPTTPLRSHETEEVRPERRAAEVLLEQGDLEGARLRLETYLATEPDDARARGLLGLCCFRLGLLDDAARLYAALVDRNPGDATLRVNLGLVALKRGDAAEAAAQFEVAVSLAPTHRKALNYLGLALAQRGELALARDAFEKAGASAMAERMSAQLAAAEEEAARSAGGSAAAEDAGPPAVAPAAEAHAAVHVAGADETAASIEGAATADTGVASGEAEALSLASDEMAAGAPAAFPADADETSVDPVRRQDATASEPEEVDAVPAEEFDAFDVTSEADASSEVAAQPAPLAFAGSTDTPAVADRFGAARDGVSAMNLFSASAGPANAIGAGAPEPAHANRADFVELPALRWPEGRPFAVDPEGTSIEFATEVRTRLDGLVAARGVAAWTPVQKRYRGAEIDRLFGAGSQQMWRATGGGRLLFHSRDRVFTSLRLEGETYFVEERVFAFDEGVRWENGRLPGQATDLHLVRFSGAGQVLVASERPLQVERVDGGCLSLPATGLVAWSGALAPRLVGAEEGPAVPWIELSGSGLVLLVG